MDKKIKLPEIVMLIDAAFLNYVISDLKSYFEKMLNRPLREIDLSLLTTYLALDAGISEGDNKAQLLFVYDKDSSKLLFCKPADLKEELNGVAFSSQFGEFSFAGVPCEEMVIREELFLDLLGIVSDSADVKKLIVISFNEEYIENWVCRRFIRFNNSGTSEYVHTAILDGLKRLAYPSIERMVRSALSEKAHESSIDVFSMNLEKLLLQPPMKDKIILGFDPAFRTGCKLAVIDASGKKLTVDVIYPHQPNAKVRESEQKLVQLCKEYHVNLIAIGNGTASRESEAFVANTIKKFNLPVSYTIVSEAGASVYSASKLAIEEFPDLHVEQRSAISIARRLMDPLSELIKIDPQSIGVGQYQHDLPTARLKERLDFVVEKAVNRVGVNINTASVSLLKNVAGLNNASATSIVSYREENGKIESRTQIKKIPKIGPKAFEQAAGFLRIEDGKEPLDRTSIHPESYKATKVLLKELGLSTSDLGTQKAKDVISNCDTKQLMQDTGLDSYTLKDILDAICLPLRDYRDKYDAPLLRKDVLEIEDLHINDKLEGTVRNVVDFGAFVDIGLHEDGLVHISKMSSNRVKHPSDVVSVGDIVTVWVYNIDQEKQKVQLTMVNPN